MFRRHHGSPCWPMAAVGVLVAFVVARALRRRRFHRRRAYEHAAARGV